MLTKEEEVIVKNHYEIALELIKLDKMSKAKQEIFNKLPLNLYDESLTLLDNRNNHTKIDYLYLKTLIEKVHDLMNDAEEKEGSDLYDKFNGIY